MIHLPFDHVHQQHALPHTKGAASQSSSPRSVRDLWSVEQMSHIT